MAQMGFREYARHRGVALRAVQKAIEAGRIKTVLVDGRAKIDSDQADREWAQNTDLAKQSLLHGTGPLPPQDADDDDPIVDTGTSGNADTEAYRKARAERERIRVEREQLELDQLRGQLIDLEEAKRLAFTAFRALRDAVLNVPARIKDQVAVESDAFRVEQLIETELAAALDKFDTARVLRDDDDDEAD
jgi:hypothetical protein